jgi:sugar lactone lactonase YvrE
VLRITPEGRIDTVASGLGDPNFILVRKGHTLLVSDDFTDEIWEVMLNGQRSIFTRAVNYPNGMAEAADGKALYVAQIFRRINPIDQDDRLWRITLVDGQPGGAPELVFRTGGAGGLDGLAMDEQGRIYVAANREGRLWRFDPRTGSAVIIAENVPGIASLAFGAGAFDQQSLYATQLRGGRIWRFNVGIRGMPLVR